MGRKRLLVLLVLAAVAVPLAEGQSSLKQERKYWRKLLTTVQKANKNDPLIYRAHMELARIEESRNNRTWAWVHYEKALRFQERTLGVDLRVAATLDEMASFQLRLSEPARTDSYQSCCCLSSDTTQEITCRTETVWVPAIGPNYLGAEVALARALKIRKQHWGDSAAELVPHLLRLCEVQRLGNRIKEARVTLAEARRVTGYSPRVERLNPQYLLCTA